MSESRRTPAGFYCHDGERGKDLLRFAEAAQVKQTESHDYQANIHLEYSYGSNAHGGYLICLLWQSIAIHFDTTLKNTTQPDSIAFHAEFLRPATPGTVTIHIKDVRIGKATSVVHASLLQNGSERVVAYCTNSGPRAARNTISKSLSYTSELHHLPIDFSAVLASKDPNWIRYDVGRDPDVPNHTLCNVIYCMQRHPPPREPKELRTCTQWLTPRIPEETWTMPLLGLVLDQTIPPLENWYEDAYHNYWSMAKAAVENERQGLSTYNHPAWMSPRYFSTVNMSIDVKRQLPPEGEKWLMVQYRTKEVIEGRMDIDIEVWNTKNELIAVAQSMWYVVDLSGASTTGGEKTGRMASLGKGSKM